MMQLANNMGEQALHPRAKSKMDSAVEYRAAKRLKAGRWLSMPMSSEAGDTETLTVDHEREGTTVRGG